MYWSLHWDLQTLPSIQLFQLHQHIPLPRQSWLPHCGPFPCTSHLADVKHTCFDWSFFFKTPTLKEGLLCKTETVKLLWNPIWGIKRTTWKGLNMTWTFTSCSKVHWTCASQPFSKKWNLQELLSYFKKERKEGSLEAANSFFSSWLISRGLLCVQ